MSAVPIVQKYGGTSVGTVELIKRVAQRVVRTVKETGQPVVVTVSAMGKRTDELVSLAKQITDRPAGRELDMLMATGEQVSIALLTMALHELGQPAISLTGPQVGIRTDDAHTSARIMSVDAAGLQQFLSEGKVVVVAGFQGLSESGELVTLGRGGSDLTAVALAGALGADRCEICTDVDGVYSGDPRYIPDARKLDHICYDEMLELASMGAKVLHSRSVEFAKKYGVQIVVRSSFGDDAGTLVSEEVSEMEGVLIRGVAMNPDEARVNVDDLPDIPGVAARVFEAIANEQINVDMIVQSAGHGGKNSISFTVDRNQLQAVVDTVKRVVDELGSGSISYDDSISKVSVVGVGMSSHSGVAATMFKALADSKINIQMISTSEIKISCIVDREQGKEATRMLHSAFGLDKE